MLTLFKKQHKPNANTTIATFIHTLERLETKSLKKRRPRKHDSIQNSHHPQPR